MTTPSDAPARARPRKERTENAERRRSQIIEATFRSIVKNGLAGTTLATVSAEAGLSQGVAVFYFQNKPALLAAALKAQYEDYQRHWRAAIEQAGADPVAQVVALVRTDFGEAVCNTDALVVWHAFWGEASARPLYAEISGAFERDRAAALRNACAAILEVEGRPVALADDIAAGIDAMTDGLWLAMYLSNSTDETARAMRLTARLLAAAFPRHAADFEAALAAPEEGP